MKYQLLLVGGLNYHHSNSLFPFLSYNNIIIAVVYLYLISFLQVISWSSLEWQRLPQKTSLTTGLFETVGTIFDLMVHLVNAYLLASQITAVEVILGIALVHFTVQILLYNPR